MLNRTPAIFIISVKEKKFLFCNQFVTIFFLTNEIFCDIIDNVRIRGSFLSLQNTEI
nr:MAG TPA: hypothetical protein [Bacteriophage sp.]